MWLVKVFSVIYFTAVCAAQDPENVSTVSRDVSPASPRPTSMKITTVDEPPVPSLQLLSHWPDVFPSEKVELSCNVAGSSDWTFSWYRNTQKLQDPDPNVSAEGSKLTITAATKTYSGNYSCNGHHKTNTGRATQTSNSVEVRVYDLPKPSLKLLSPWPDVFENETVEFSCEGESADWTITWYKVTKGTNEEKLEDIENLEMLDSYLNITEVTQADEGGYACKAQLESRKVSSGFSDTFQITVYENLPKPTVSKVPTFYPMYVGETVNFTCNVDVSSGWEYQWYKNGVQFSDANKTISIRLSLSDQGKYWCMAYRGETTSTDVSKEIQQDVLEIPVPSVQQITDWMDVFPTESVKLSCNMSDSSDWIYTWYKDEKEVQAPFDSKGATLTITSASAAHEGQYKCKGHLNERSVSSRLGSGLSLKVYDKKPEVILTQDPEYNVMFPGESVSFSCHINVSIGWEYLWYQDGNPLTASGNKYPISSVGTTNMGSYKCEAKRGSEQNFLTIVSQDIRLEVTENKPKPSMTQQPAVDMVYTGESVSFNCKVDSSSGWVYYWYKNGTPLPINTGSFIISDASLSNSGTYNCMAIRDKTKYKTEHSVERILRVSEIPVPSVQQITDWMDVFPTESVKLSCNMSDSSDWTYTWYKDEKEVQAPFDSKGATLTITSASAAHEGQYKCKGHLNERSVSSRLGSGLSLKVYDKKPEVILTQDPEYNVMFPGESVSFSCHINVSIGWEYLWYQDGNPLTASGNKYAISSVGTTNMGSYKCEAKRGSEQNFLTIVSQDIRLEVTENKPKPSMTQQPAVDMVYTGESVSFNCKVDSSSGWVYYWYKNGTPLLINTGSFIISDASLSNSGTYNCMAIRDKTKYKTEHSVERILRVSEIPVPSVQQITDWMDVFPTESVKLSCNMSHSSDWTYTWYKDRQQVQADNTVSFDSDAATLSISSASASHRGQYSCLGKLKSRPVSSIVSSEITLHVYDTKPRVTLMQNPIHNVMHTGDPVTYSCHINVSSGWEYLWHKDGSPLNLFGNNHSISSAVRKNTGSYQCQVKRGSKTIFWSDQSQAVKLDIEERPKADIILLTGWSEVFSTDSLVLRCGMQESQDIWNYTWFKEGKQINLLSEKHTVTPQNDPEQSQYTCEGIRTGRPSYSKRSDPYMTKNLLLKRKVLLSISGCIFFGIIIVFPGCIVLRIFCKPADGEEKPEETELFITMAQLKNSDEGEENGTICSETTPLPITLQEDQGVTSESHDTTENNGELISFKH
ncbi:hemicentin-1 [Cottoperca gobio]|uniref:Hemicentin-1 n=1 Tax=Cottoperca gobio TaxID=56716 RepID=A0A6J2PYZ8_COTGO|nr:hemicentin-1-like [Cottoperca gobio]